MSKFKQIYSQFMIKHLISTFLIAFVIYSLSVTPLHAANKDHYKISVADVMKAQDAWAAGLVEIGKVYSDNGDYQKVAKKLINELYAYNYEKGIVLFKPTKASEVPFRKTKESALSYFVGDNAKFSEDKGFAIHPWSKVVFHNDEMYFHKNMAIAMGTYDFFDMKGNKTTVEYTFGYIETPNGQVKIVLHHSSLPYQK